MATFVNILKNINLFQNITNEVPFEPIIGFFLSNLKGHETLSNFSFVHRMNHFTSYYDIILNAYPKNEISFVRGNKGMHKSFKHIYNHFGNAFVIHITQRNWSKLINILRLVFFKN